MILENTHVHMVFLMNEMLFLEIQLWKVQEKIYHTHWKNWPLNNFDVDLNINHNPALITV